MPLVSAWYHHHHANMSPYRRNHIIVFISLLGFMYLHICIQCIQLLEVETFWSPLPVLSASRVQACWGSCPKQTEQKRLRFQRTDKTQRETRGRGRERERQSERASGWTSLRMKKSNSAHGVLPGDVSTDFPNYSFFASLHPSVTKPLVIIIFLLWIL